MAGHTYEANKIDPSRDAPGYEPRAQGTRRKGGAMPSERLMYLFPDGNREHRHPVEMPKVGDRMTRRGRHWVVISIHDRGDVTIVTLHRASKDGNQDG